MQKSFDLDYEDYASLLTNLGIRYSAVGNWLQVGTPSLENKWLLFITVRTLQATRLLKVILPFLCARNVSFRVVKDQLLVNKTNGWAFGEQQVGKIITIYTNSTEHATRLIEDLLPLTDGFSGPAVPNCIRLGEIVYATFSQFIASEDKNTTGTIQLGVPKKLAVPFKMDRRYAPRKRKRLIGRYYVPIEVVHSSPKGFIYKAINIRRFSFTWCLIKEGYKNAVDDFQSRDAKHRLLWQRDVLMGLERAAIAPKFLDYFEQNGDGYLVMEFIEGENLDRIIGEMQNGHNWKQLPADHQQLLLRYFLKVLRIVETMHNLGYIHRDITPANFIVQQNGEVKVVDLELAYNSESRRPDPPFVLGTPGYLAPEQRALALPTVKEDIYSLGSLLLRIVTGISPSALPMSTSTEMEMRLNEAIEDYDLKRLALNCLDVNPSCRPELKDIKYVIGKLCHMQGVLEIKKLPSSEVLPGLTTKP